MSKVKKTSTNYENKQLMIDECIEMYAIHLLSGQWTMAIGCYLLQGPLRFGELRKCLPTITERMLTLHLRKMEQNKLIKRTVYAEVPPRVEYELTEIGLGLEPIIKLLAEWGEMHKNAVKLAPTGEPVSQ
jgi:DNA-binding HxlR family transcriptional regulator